MWHQQRQQNWTRAKLEFEQETSTEVNLATLLSAAQCQQIVGNFNAIHKTNMIYLRHKISTADEAKGFLGEYFHLIVLCATNMRSEDLTEKDNGGNDASIDEEAEVAILKFFIKKLPFAHEDDERLMIFRKESLLYSLLFPKIQEYAPIPWSPKVYLSTNTVLVLQDLEEIGYRALTFKDNLHKSEMLPILKSLAAMHASSLLYELNSHKSMEDFPSDCLKEITVHPEIPWFATGLRALMDIARNHSKYQNEVSQEFINKELPHHLKSVYFMVNPSPRYRNVVCHRDTWGGNICINAEDTEASAILVDFQTCRYCPPAIDLIYTLFLNLTKEERLNAQSEYLHYYWQQLQTFVGSEIELSESEFLESYEEFQLIGCVYRTLAMTLIKVPTEFVTEEYRNVERSQQVLEYMKENEIFCQLMEECVEEVIEAAVENSIKSEIY